MKEILERVSVRKYEARPVEREKLEAKAAEEKEKERKKKGETI